MYGHPSTPFQSSHLCPAPAVTLPYDPGLIPESLSRQLSYSVELSLLLSQLKCLPPESKGQTYFVQLHPQGLGQCLAQNQGQKINT